MQHAAFILLALAIASVWWPTPVATRVVSGGIPPWLILYVAALALALAAGVVHPSGLAALALLFALGRWGRHARGRWAVLATALAGLMALSLALHAAPGFDNPRILQDMRFRAAAPPFTLHANFDKGSVGLFLLVCLAPRWQDRRAVAAALPSTLCIAVITSATVLGLASVLGVVAPESGWPGPAERPHAVLIFLAVNLFFTCVAEEAFFRGLIQERLHRALRGPGMLAKAVPVLVSALLFGVAHLGGGPVHAVLAMVAGLGYALAYARTGTIEAAILAHFAVNTVHVLAFTYPRLA